MDSAKYIGLDVLCAFQAPASSQSAGAKAKSETQSFDLDSTGSTYPFVMRSQGTVEIREDGILVQVEQGLVRSAIPERLAELGEVRDVQIAFGIGKLTANGWDSENDTPPQRVAMLLKPGEQRDVPALSFTISGIKGKPLAEEWLEAELIVEQRLPSLPAGPLRSYACAETNLLGPTAASLSRAEAMKRNYSQTC